jgi:hypothetical protein
MIYKFKAKLAYFKNHIFFSDNKEGSEYSLIGKLYTLWTPDSVLDVIDEDIEKRIVEVTIEIL